VGAWLSPLRDARFPGGQAGELALHGVDVREIPGDVVVTALLARRQPEATARMGIARPLAAEMDERREILLLSRNAEVSSMAWLGTTRK